MYYKKQSCCLFLNILHLILCVTFKPHSHFITNISLHIHTTSQTQSNSLYTIYSSMIFFFKHKHLFWYIVLKYSLFVFECLLMKPSKNELYLDLQNSICRTCSHLFNDHNSEGNVLYRIYVLI